MGSLQCCNTIETDFRTVLTRIGFYPDVHLKYHNGWFLSAQHPSRNIITVRKHKNNDNARRLVRRGGGGGGVRLFRQYKIRYTF